MNGFLEFVNLLLLKNVDLELLNDENMTARQLALLNGHFDVAGKTNVFILNFIKIFYWFIIEILKNHAKYNILSENIVLAFHMIKKTNKYDIIQYLIENEGVPLDSIDPQNENESLIKGLIEKVQKNIDNIKNKAIIEICRKNGL